MSIEQLLAEAATLMGTGMLVVFVFLTILIFAVKALAVIGQHISLEEPQATPVRRAPQTKVSAEGVPQPVVAAITAAIHQHRNQAK